MSQKGLTDLIAGATPYLRTALRLRAWHGVYCANPIPTLTPLPHPLSGISDAEVRVALSRKVMETSLRSVAVEVGLTHASLKHYIAGKTRPREATRRKLYEWFMDQPPPTEVEARRWTRMEASYLTESISNLLQASLSDGLGADTAEAYVMEAVRTAFHNAKPSPPNRATS